jgi:hypothetical protein
MRVLAFRFSLAREAQGTIAGAVSPRAYVAPRSPIAHRDDVGVARDDRKRAVMTIARRRRAGAVNVLVES